ncbi:transposable element Tcb2 transposase [Trichonephila clavipes]|nr:transposable element Tcb2 transposase [Trichonephila clavipes]
MMEIMIENWVASTYSLRSAVLNACAGERPFKAWDIASWKVFEIRIRSHLENLAPMLHGNPYVVKDSPTQSSADGAERKVSIWNLFLETGRAGRRQGQGRMRATTPNEDRYLVLMARRYQNMNATLLQRHLRSAAGTTVSTQTVRNQFHGVGLYARRPMVCARLTSRHRRDRREWVTEHVNWRRKEWSNVLFSDESHFYVHPDNKRIFIWRDRGSRNNHAFVQESVRFGGGGMLVYSGISIDGRTDL